MTHETSTVILRAGLLDMFDPNEPEYTGIREHFSAQELETIDELRARDPETATFTFLEKVFVSYVVDKAIFAGT
jgi:hypothetical protein